MGWRVEEVLPKPYQLCGHVGKLICDMPGVYGSINVEGWLFGCAQNGLFGFSHISGVTDAVYEEFLQFLRTLTTDLNTGQHGYRARRYLFIVTHSQRSCNPLVEMLVKDSVLLGEHSNLSHGGSINYTYRLDL